MDILISNFLTDCIYPRPTLLVSCGLYRKSASQSTLETTCSSWYRLQKQQQQQQIRLDYLFKGICTCDLPLTWLVLFPIEGNIIWCSLVWLKDCGSKCLGEKLWIELGGKPIPRPRPKPKQSRAKLRYPGWAGLFQNTFPMIYYLYCLACKNHFKITKSFQSSSPYQLTLSDEFRNFSLKINRVALGE